jgi:hypothetical protein
MEIVKIVSGGGYSTEAAIPRTALNVPVKTYPQPHMQ